MLAALTFGAKPVADFEPTTPIKAVFDLPVANTAGTAITQGELGYNPTPPNAPIEIRRMATRGAAPYRVVAFLAARARGHSAQRQHHKSA